VCPVLAKYYPCLEENVMQLVSVDLDPFDRLLIAQAMVEDILLISADSVFSLYPVQRMWE
jgi:PIN domain nuclease of toxin-antitoxin system